MGVGNVLVTIMFAHYMSMSMRDQQEKKKSVVLFFIYSSLLPFFVLSFTPKEEMG